MPAWRRERTRLTRRDRKRYSWAKRCFLLAESISPSHPALLCPGLTAQSKLVMGSTGQARHPPKPARPDRQRGEGNLFVFLDLENLAFLAESLQPLSLACRRKGLSFRSYCSPDHSQANRATHLSRSNKKEAVDVKMVCDAARLSDDSEILVITDDLFGDTLQAELKTVTHVTYDGRLPARWRSRLDDAASISDFFKRFDVHRERRSRTPSVVSGRSRGTRASWSRPPPTDRGRQRSRGRPGHSPSYHGDVSTKRHGPRKWPRGVVPSKGKHIGTITVWMGNGYGFISPHPAPGVKGDVFVHISNVIVESNSSFRQLHRLKGWDVEFEVQRNAKGLTAANVTGPRGRALPADA